MEKQKETERKTTTESKHRKTHTDREVTERKREKQRKTRIHTNS